MKLLGKAHTYEYSLTRNIDIMAFLDTITGNNTDLSAHEQAIHKAIQYSEKKILNKDS